jgi:hypothetical protein
LTLVDRIIAPGLVVGALLSFGAAITSLGVALATWVPRAGRAIAINVVVLLLLGIGWPLLFEIFLSGPIQQWLYMKSGIDSMQLLWLDAGLNAVSPFVAPVMILQSLGKYPWPGRGLFWLCALAWEVLAATAAALMYWGMLRTFDLYLGRVRETSASNRNPNQRVRRSRPDDLRL